MLELALERSVLPGLAQVSVPDCSGWWIEQGLVQEQCLLPAGEPVALVLSGQGAGPLVPV